MGNFISTKVGGARMDPFSFAPTSPRILNTRLVQDDKKIQIKIVAGLFPNNLHECLIHYESEDSPTA